MKHEYIPGDLVKETIGGNIIQIINNGYHFINLSNDVNGTLLENEIESIPLTSEILEKNGWILSGDSWLLKINNDITLCILFFKDIVVCYVRATNEVTHKEHNFQRIKLGEPHYLHQLQHILFGLGINSEIKI